MTSIYKKWWGGGNFQRHIIDINNGKYETIIYIARQKRLLHYILHGILPSHRKINKYVQNIPYLFEYAEFLGIHT